MDKSPKIVDFGLVKLFPGNLAHISTRVAGTLSSSTSSLMFKIFFDLVDQLYG
jgi:hypothetical protein